MNVNYQGQLSPRLAARAAGLKIALATPLLVLAAGCSSTPHPPAAHHPVRLTVLGDCRKLRADVLANGGAPDAQTIRFLMGQDTASAGAVHGQHGLTADLDQEYDAVTARGENQTVRQLTIGTWLAALSGDCQRAVDVTVPYGN
jgi:hypothetical protein